MKRLIYVLTFGLLIGTSCKNYDQQKVNYEVTDFSNEIHLNSEKLEITSVLLNPDRIRIIDSYLVVLQDRKDTLVSIFNLQDLKHLFSFGMKGRGPNEFNLSFPTSFNTAYVNDGGFTLGNMMNNIQYYKIDDLLNKNSVPYKIAKLPPKLNGFCAITLIGDSLIYGAPYGGDNIDLFKYNLQSKQLDILVEYPRDFPLINNEIKRSIYVCYMTTKPDNTKFARTYSNIGRIEIFDVNNDKRPHYNISYKKFPTLKENLNLDRSSKAPRPDGEEKIFSWGFTSNDKYIYVQVYNDKYDKIAGSNGPNKSFIPEIHIFKWDGQPVAKCILDSHFISFDVDKAGKYIYTISYFEPNIIRRYDLSKSIL